MVAGAEALKGITAVVTGATRGIGLSTAIGLVKAGANVAAVGRSRDSLDAAQRRLATFARHGQLVLPLLADVRRWKDIRHATKRAMSESGRVDLLVNCAGVGVFGPVTSYKISDYDAMMDTNMKGTFLWCRSVLPGMIRQRSGHVINVASVAGLKGLIHESLYCASKFAVVGFSQALDHELRQHNVRISVVCPGGVATQFALGKGRAAADLDARSFMEPDDVAEIILAVACQPPTLRIMNVVFRPLSEPLP